VGVRTHLLASSTTRRWATLLARAVGPRCWLSLSISLKVGRPAVADYSETRCPLASRRPVAYSYTDGPKFRHHTRSTFAVAWLCNDAEAWRFGLGARAPSSFRETTGAVVPRLSGVFSVKMSARKRLKGVHRSRVCICRDEYACVYLSIYVCTL
jgi:hypothetical protein